jgi:hypothetical protein
MKRLKRSAFFLCLVTASCLLPPREGHAESRAFVAALNTYDKKDVWEPLRTAVKDATALEEVLRAAKFQVTSATDVTLADFSKRWAEFLSSLQPDDLAFFYFAGHGFQVDGVNFLVLRDSPAPAPAATEAAQVQGALNFYELMQQVQQRRPARSVFILDACRTSPGPGSMASARFGQLRRFAVGEEVYGTFVMFSAGSGQSALDSLLRDGDKPVNSVYARRLLPLLKRPELGLNEIATNVRVQVEKDARSDTPPFEQSPAYIDGIRSGQYRWDRLGPAEKAPAPDKTVISATVMRLGGFATWNENCQSQPAPRIATVSRPRFGRIFTRFESFTAGGTQVGVSCDGTLQKGVGVYYAIDDTYKDSTAVDSVQLTVKHWSVSPSAEVSETFIIDLSDRTSRMTTTERPQQP